MKGALACRRRRGGHTVPGSSALREFVSIATSFLRAGLMDYPVLDTRGADWTVFRPAVRRFYNLGFAIYLALIGAAFLAGGVASFTGGKAWQGLGLCALGLGLWALQHGLIWSYYVAVNESHVAAGRMRSRGIDIVECSKIASVTWRAGQKVERGVLCSAEGKELLALGQWLGKQQVAEMEETIGVPFTVTRPGPTRPKRNPDQQTH